MPPSGTRRQSPTYPRPLTDTSASVNGLSLRRAAIDLDVLHGATKPEREKKRDDRDAEHGVHRPVERVLHGDDPAVRGVREQDRDRDTRDRTEERRSDART